MKIRFYFIILALALTFLFSLSVVVIADDENKQTNSIDHNAVISVINKIGTAADMNDWQAVKASFADEVYLDYTSMSGGEPATLTPEQIVTAWRKFLPGFELTKHTITNHDVTIKGDAAECFAYVSALHFIDGAKGGETWTVHGFYNSHLVKTTAGWKVDAMKFTKTLIEGNLKLPVIAQKRVQPKVQEVKFSSAGTPMVGRLYLPGDYQIGDKLPAVIVGGSWTTVKEQMAGTYAAEVARMGLAALVFDHRGYGMSGGEPRDYESPVKKIEDFQNAITYLETVESVDASRIGALGVCASAGYLAHAAAKDPRMRSLATAAAWLHEPETVKLIYGGEEGVDKKIESGKAARQKYEKTGEIEYVPAISTTDKNAAMFGEFDYYLNPERGAIPEWSNRFAVMSWTEWLTFDAIEVADNLQIPTLIIHSKKAALPQGAEKFFKGLKGPKTIMWLDGTHFDFYDNDIYVRRAAFLAADHFRNTLN